MRSGLMSGVAIALLAGRCWAAPQAHAAGPAEQAQAKQELNAGFSLMQQGQLDEAIVHTEKAAALDSHLAQAQLNLGILYSQKNNLPAAIRHMKRAVALEPGNFNARFNLGFLYQSSGHDAEAEVQYRRALKINPDAASAHLNLGIVLSKKHSPEAASHCQRAFELNPGTDTPACPR